MQIPKGKKMKKEKKKKSEGKEVKTKTARGCAGSRAFVAAIVPLLSAAPSGVKDERLCSA